MLWGRKGKPTIGGFIQMVGGAYFNIQGWASSEEGSPLPGGINKIGQHRGWVDTMGNPVFRMCQETLAIILFGGIFGFDIDRKFSFNH